MKNICTHTNATFTTADGKTFSYQEIFESVKTSVEIYGSTGGRLLSVEDLEDLFQDAILKVLRYHGGYDPGKSQLKTWAAVISRSAQVDAYKKRLKQLVMFVDPEQPCEEGAEPDGSFFDRVPGGSQADLEVEGNEAMDRIMKAIDSLCENYRFVISLQLEEMKPQKMAEVIGCTADAAGTRLFRARNALLKRLGKPFLSEYGIVA